MFQATMNSNAGIAKGFFTTSVQVRDKLEDGGSDATIMKFWGKSNFSTEGQAGRF